MVFAEAQLLRQNEKALQVLHKKGTTCLLLQKTQESRICVHLDEHCGRARRSTVVDLTSLTTARCAYGANSHPISLPVVSHHVLSMLCL